MYKEEIIRCKMLRGSKTPFFLHSFSLPVSHSLLLTSLRRRHEGSKETDELREGSDERSGYNSCTAYAFNLLTASYLIRYAYWNYTRPDRIVRIQPAFYCQLISEFLSSFIYCFRPVSMEGYRHSITAYFILEVKELYGLIII